MSIKIFMLLTITIYQLHCTGDNLLEPLKENEDAL